MNNKKNANMLKGVCGIAILLGLPLSANALPDGQQLIKYFNPIHEKSYLNESQDRLIKKKAFKGKEITGVNPIANKDIGLFAILSPQQWTKSIYQDDKNIDALLAQGQINGISCTIPWRVLQPQEDKFDWQIIDALLTACRQYNKQLILRVSTCGIDMVPGFGESKSDTPDWVFAAGAKSIAYKGKDGKQHEMPIFWDGTYLAKWANFVGELGKRYDKSTGIQSIGITGGGVLGGTNVIPDFTGDKAAVGELTEILKTKYEMSPRQLVNHWKYAADIFPKAFQTQHLNFDLDPPTADRKGQDSLDEIADYLVYRYGQRVYLTRQNVKDDKHGFDQYRLLLKYKNDTLSGYQTTPALFGLANVGAAAMPPVSPVLATILPKLAKNAFDDGLSFAEIPAVAFDSKDAAVKDWLNQMRLHLGYQLILLDYTMPESLQAGKPLHLELTFINNGAASPKRISREMDKGVATSFKMQVAIKNADGKIVALVRHTPSTSTVDWVGQTPISWEQELKMPALKPGKYNIALEIIDEQTGQKLNFIVDRNGKPSEPASSIALGNLEITK